MNRELTRREMLQVSGAFWVGSLLNACGDYITHETSKGDTMTENIDPLTERAIKLQKDYWIHDPEEKSALLSRYPDSLSWPEILRLHHLNCLELLNSDSCKSQWLKWHDRTVGEIDDAPKGPLRDICQELIQLLVSPESPYCPRVSYIWLGEVRDSDRGPPQSKGILRNASLTHLGCIEVIRVDENEQPKELTFIPFDDMRGILFANPSLFRVAKIMYYNSSRDEVVFVPLLYGVSWFTKYKMDHDGSFTRFCCSFPMKGYDFEFSIGIGHQDFITSKDEKLGMDSLFGLGSLVEIMFPLETNDAKFDQKCRALGLDPDSVRKDFEKNQPKQK